MSNYSITVNGIEYEIQNPIKINDEDVFYIDLSSIGGEKFVIVHQKTVIRKPYLQGPTQ